MGILHQGTVHRRQMFGIQALPENEKFCMYSQLSPLRVRFCSRASFRDLYQLKACTSQCLDASARRLLSPIAFSILYITALVIVF